MYKIYQYPTEEQGNGRVKQAVRIVSPESGRTGFFTSVTYADDHPNKKARNKAGLDVLEKDLAEWKAEDERLRQYFNVAVKKLSLTHADLSHFTPADMENLIEQIKFSDIFDFAESLGVNVLETKEDDEAPYRHEKRVILELLKKDPSIDLGLFLRKSATRLTIKPEYKDEVLDRDGQNIVLKDGTIVGNRFNSKKIERFLERQAEFLKSAKDVGEVRKLYAFIEKFYEASFITSTLRNELKGKVWYNPNFGNGSGQQRSYYDYLYEYQDGVSTEKVRRLAIADEIAEKDEEKRTSRLSKMIDGVISLEKNYSLPFTDIEKKAHEVYDAYVTALEQWGGHSEGADKFPGVLKSELAQAKKAHTAYAEVVSWVRTYLDRENKPYTVGRVETAVKEFISEKKPGSYFTLSRHGYGEKPFDEIFKPILDEQTQKDQKKKKVKTTFSAKRVKSSQTAAFELAFRLDELDEENKSLLIDLVVSDEDGLKQLLYMCRASDKGEAQSYRRSKNPFEVPEKYKTGIMRAREAFKVVIAAKQKLVMNGLIKIESDARSYALEALLDLGVPTEQVDWNLLSNTNMERLYQKVPNSFALKAVRIVLDSRESSDEVLNHLFGKIDPEAVDEKTLQDLLHEAMERGRASTGILLPHLKRFASKKESLKKIMLRALAETDDGLITISPDEIPDDGELAFYLFGRSFETKAKGHALTYLKKALAIGNTNVDSLYSVESATLGRESYGSVNGLNDLFACEELIGDQAFAAVLIKIVRDMGIVPSDLGSSYQLDDEGLPVVAVKNLEILFRTVGLGEKELYETVANFLGADSAPAMRLAEKASLMGEADTIEMIISEKNTKQTAREQRRGYDQYHNRRSSHDSHYDIQMHQLKHLNALIERDRRFATISNALAYGSRIGSLPELSIESLEIFSQLTSSVFQQFSHAARQDRISSFLALFGKNALLSKRIILSAHLTPGVAVLCAENLEPGAVEETKERLVAVARKSQKALGNIKDTVEVEETENDKRRRESNPKHLTSEFLEGKRDFSEKQWDILLQDEASMVEIMSQSPVDAKVLKQLDALADTFEVNLLPAVRKAAKNVSFPERSIFFDHLFPLIGTRVTLDDFKSLYIDDGKFKVENLKGALNFAAKYDIDPMEIIDEALYTLTNNVYYGHKDAKELLSELIQAHAIGEKVLKSVESAYWFTNEEKKAAAFVKFVKKAANGG